mgnify:CR=1 FL=1
METIKLVGYAVITIFAIVASVNVLKAINDHFESK